MSCVPAVATVEVDVSGRQERKVVTVLFCDLVGSTAQAEEMDPEDVASLLAPYHARVKEELERFGGTVEKFIGDAVMALFGAPVAHEDDPERAVRAALAIQAFAEDEGIELRIGITTGEALVTLDARPDAGETMAAGDVVNTAARLQSAAPVNGILVGAKTYEATKGAIDYGVATAVEAKGKSHPVAVWEARRARSRIGVDRPHGANLVGRERELDVLVAALTRAREERQPQLVTLVGVPGIGKSRLVYELSQQADRDPELVAWRQGRCLPYGDGVTFWALAEIVKAQLGITDGDSVAETEATLDAAVDDEWLRDRLRPLIGLSSEEFGAADRSEETFAAWRRFLESIADERPLVLVFEDLHWADERLLDFVDYLVDWATGVTLVVVCTARPELLERRAGWGGGKTNAATISLSPLSEDDTARLVAELLAQAVMPPELQRALLARAGGNPLYAEQYARMFSERAGDDLPLPETVQGLIAARLDELDPEQKAILQDASVIGRTFWLDALVAMSGAEPRALEERLHALERKGFVRREREASIEGSSEFAFLHLLVHDVAYGQIPRAPRAERHIATAGWIEGLERREEHAEMLAHHYGEAIVLSRAAGGETGTIEGPARRALREAGDRALALHAYVAARRYYERALELWPSNDEERPGVLLSRAKATLFSGEYPVELFAAARDALLEQGDRERAAEAETYRAFAMWNSGMAEEPDVLEAARSAAVLVDDTPTSPVKAYVVANFARYLSLVGRPEDAMPVARDALAMADELGLGEIRANALNTLGMARVAIGDVDGLDELEESFRLARRHGSPVEISRTANNLGVMSLFAGRTARGAQVLRARSERDRSIGLPTWMGDAQVASLDFVQGEWDRALCGLDANIEGGYPTAEWIQSRSIRAEIRLSRDDVAGFESEFEVVVEAMSKPAEIGDAGGALIAARLALAADRRADAEALVDWTLASAWSRPYAAWTALELALTLDDLGRSMDPILEAERMCPRLPWVQAAAAVARGARLEAADQAHVLLSPPLESQIRLRLAKRLVDEGRQVEADEQLDLAIAFWLSVGATRYIREAEALRSSTSAQSNS